MARFQEFLSNEPDGTTFRDIVIPLNGAARATSVHGFSGLHAPIWTMPQNMSGKIVDFQIGVDLPAVSAASFPAAANGVTAFPRVNSVAVLSTDPLIAIAGSAGQAVRTFTGTGGALVTSTVINAASAGVPAGAEVTWTFDAKSVGSGAATAAGIGLYGFATIRLYTS